MAGQEIDFTTISLNIEIAKSISLQYNIDIEISFTTIPMYRTHFETFDKLPKLEEATVNLTINARDVYFLIDPIGGRLLEVGAFIILTSFARKFQYKIVK